MVFGEGNRWKKYSDLRCVFLLSRYVTRDEAHTDSMSEATNAGRIVSSESKPAGEVQSVFLKLSKALVDEPEAVILEVVTSEAGTVFHLHVSSRDRGKLIGKQGRTAQAIRLLLTSASTKYHQRFELSIEEAIGRE